MLWGFPSTLGVCHFVSSPLTSPLAVRSVTGRSKYGSSIMVTCQSHDFFVDHMTTVLTLHTRLLSCSEPSPLSPLPILSSSLLLLSLSPLPSLSFLSLSSSLFFLSLSPLPLSPLMITIQISSLLFPLASFLYLFQTQPELFGHPKRHGSTEAQASEPVRPHHQLSSLVLLW